MSRVRSYSLVACLAVPAVLLAFVVGGCETAETNTAITITPGSVVLTGVGASVAFTATAVDVNRPLFLPLVWTASNPEIGNVTGEGVTGVYVSRGGVGSNVITVRDQAGASGIAVVTQQAAP